MGKKGLKSPRNSPCLLQYGDNYALILDMPLKQYLWRFFLSHGEKKSVIYLLNQRDHQKYCPPITRKCSFFKSRYPANRAFLQNKLHGLYLIKFRKACITQACYTDPVYTFSLRQGTSLQARKFQLLSRAMQHIDDYSVILS